MCNFLDQPLLQGGGENGGINMGPSATLQNITFYTCGSRGDVQPFVGVALGLKKQGYNVKFLTCSGHVPFIESFGLKAVSIGSDFEDVMKSDPYMRRAMANGNTLEFMMFISHFFTSTADLTCRNFLKEMTENRPDLLICGTMSEYLGWYAVSVLKIPSIQLKIEIMVHDSLRAPWGFPTLPFGAHLFIMKILLSRIYETFKGFDKAMLKCGGTDVCSFTTARRVVSEGFQPMQPIMVLISPLYRDTMFPHAHKNLRFVGSSVIEKSIQKTNSNFGNSEQHEGIEKFLSEGSTKPVYMGWGSMICKNAEYMTEIAVHTLFLTGQRGIVLGGYAGLKEEMLDAIKNPKLRQQLKNYAKKNVLFVPFCPHELVLPHVSCVVHHGGAGTTNASLRSGAPTVITPVFWDQYDYAHLVQTKGVGVGFSKQFQRVTVNELADAVKLCITDVDIQKRATEFSKELRSDANGVDNVVNYVERFWKNEVLPGSWLAEIEEEKQRAILEVKALTSSRRKWIFGFVGIFAGILCYAYMARHVM